jgi:hypothetical protein
MQDDVYKGMLIPKGSIIIANALCVPAASSVLLMLTTCSHPPGVWHWTTKSIPIPPSSILSGSYPNPLVGMRSPILLVRSDSDDGELDI